ncbi:hypothetical protein ACFVZD_30295 [Streptomyces sp. NPDC058287]|uniref:hypothetical protein n=1 Tax=unclassified Streptomyces TaxID=2593676 RepID=UPI0036E7B39E
MRTLAITQNITVDGCVEMLTDWFEPQAQGNADMADVLEEGVARTAGRTRCSWAGAPSRTSAATGPG